MSLLIGIGSASPKQAGAVAFGGNSNEITTAQFVELLRSLNAFNFSTWVARGTAELTKNQVLSDVLGQKLHLASCTVEVVRGEANSSGEYDKHTIRITTPNANGITDKGTLKSIFVYTNSGAPSAPGWSKIGDSTELEQKIDSKLEEAGLQLKAHTGNNTIHVTATERSTWSAKATADDIASKIAGHNTSGAAHDDIRQALTTAHTDIAALRGSGLITHDTLKKASEAIDALLSIVESDDTDLDTVREIVTFIKNNKNVVDSIATNKLDKSAYNAFVEQMDSELQSLTAALAAKAAASHTHTKANITDFPASMPASDVSAWAKAASKPSYTFDEITGKPSFQYSYNVPSGTDFDTLTTPGFYYCAADVVVGTMPNRPKANAFGMIVFNASGTVQCYYLYADPSEEYRRRLYSGTWSSWVKMPRTSDIPTTAAQVGAAAESHTHSTLTVNVRGTTAKTYNGSAAVTINTAMRDDQTCYATAYYVG